jgi:hypothetical protein
MNPDLSSKIISFELYPYERLERPEILDPKPFADFRFDERQELFRVGACKTIVDVHCEQAMNKGRTPRPVEDEEGMIKFRANEPQCFEHFAKKSIPSPARLFQSINGFKKAPDARREGSRPPHEDENQQLSPEERTRCVEALKMPALQG